MFITKPINIDSYQASLKAVILHYGTTQDGHYTAVIKKGNWRKIKDIKPVSCIVS